MLDDTMGPAVFVMTEGKLYTATITMTVNFLAPAKPDRSAKPMSPSSARPSPSSRGRLMAEDGTVLAWTATDQRARTGRAAG